MSAVRVLVTGATGQIGGALLAMPNLDGCVILQVSHSRLDLAHIDRLTASLDRAAPDIIVNCAAYTAVDRAEADVDAAFAVNAEGPAVLASWCSRRNAVLIQLSTDYVFDGTREGKYSPADPTNPINVYGASKEAGERAVRQRCGRHLILRTSWIYSETGRNFVRTILSLGLEREELRVVADQRGCPTAAKEVGAALHHLLARLATGDPPPWGTWHFAGAGEATWLELAEEAWARAGARLGRRPRIIPISSQEFPTAARRPLNCVLDCEESFAVLGVRARRWRQALADTVNAILSGDTA